ncbi:582_t:CDS:2 [Dentiscutata erythropus]|uniref:582_t:CDS:1 n=1 Tax=Dentiscutata erythropus TaxID=1348616 RepID=A0A9N9EQV5_9GLOM|nr:582_t:CDS:2 [Dentiscutata erythropus]
MVKIDGRIKKEVERFLSMEDFHYSVIFEKEPRETSIFIGNKVIESDITDSKRSYALKDDLLMECKEVLVKINAIFNHDNQDYSGSQLKEEKIEHKPQLYPPIKLKSKYIGHDKILTTEIVSEDEDTQQYYCELIYISDNNNSSDFVDNNVAYHEIIDVETLKSTLWEINTEEKSIPGPGGEYKVRVSARADNCKNSEFKYTDEIIFRMTPPLSVEFTHFYDYNIDYLEILVKDTTNQPQPSLGYTYQVINSDDNVIYTSSTNDIPNLNLDIIRNRSENFALKNFIRVKGIAIDESNWMDSSYTTSKSFKFFSQVNNIKGSYDIDNNVLKISWDPVENAKKYEVTLYCDERRLATDLTSKTLTSFDIWKFEEKIESYSRYSYTPYISYTFAIQAKNKLIEERIDFFDGPVTDAEKDFKQLPKPTNIIMKKKSDRLNVSYKPITFSETSNIFKGYKVKLYKVRPKNEYSVAELSTNNHLVAESPLIESSYYDFIIKDIKFEENRNYQVEVEAEVYAVVKNDQAINSFPEKSTRTIKFLPSPKDLQISAKANESHEPTFVVSCAFNSEIPKYVLGVINTKTEKTVQSTIEDCSPSRRVEQKFHNNSDLLDSSDSSEIVKFRAFTQAIGDDDQIDSDILMSVSEIIQCAAPKNVTYAYNNNLFFGHEFKVMSEVPEGSKGYYEIQIIKLLNNYNDYIIIEKKETKEKEDIIIIKRLDKGIYKVRVRQIPYEPDWSISSNWKPLLGKSSITDNLLMMYYNTLNTMLGNYESGY